MDYGSLLTRAWNTIWNNKFLIVLGILAALGGGGGGGGNSGGFNNRVPSQPGVSPTPGPGGGLPPNFLPQLEQQMRQYGTMILAIILIALCIGLVIGLALFVLRRIAEGGMISGVDTIESGGAASFGKAFSAGWGKVWRMVLISLLAAIPTLLFVCALVAIGYGYFTSGGLQRLISAANSNNPSRIMEAFSANMGFWIAFAAVFCPMVVVGWVMGAIRTFADRACMIENKGVMDSFTRGWQVLRDHIGPAIVLLLIQIGIGIGLAIVLFLPSILIAFCCILWPLLWVVSGTITSYFSTLWTLAWREWTGGSMPVGEPPAAAPASLG